MGKNKVTKKKGKWPVILCICIAIVGIFSLFGSDTESSSNSESSQTQEVKTEYGKLDKYEWGEAAKQILEEIGVKKVKKVEVRDNEDHSIIYDVFITTEAREIQLMPTENIDGWEILWVSNGANDDDVPYGASYYMCDSLKFDDAGVLVEDLYSYETGELIAAKDTEAAALEDARRQKVADAVLDASTRPTEPEVTFEEIYVAYKENELRADDLYKGNRYIITAEVNNMETDGLLNMTGGATLAMEKVVGNTRVFFYASFEKEQEEALKTINVGDTITFEGDCLSAGSWADCELIQ